MPISIVRYCRWAAAVCMSGCVSLGAANPGGAVRSGNVLLTRDRLSRMYTLTALDALGVLPGFNATASVGVQYRYVVFLDGTLAADLEVLRAIRATDLAEVRIVNGPEAASGSGARTQIRITTLGAFPGQR